MSRSKLFAIVLACLLPVALLPSAARAQEYPQPMPHPHHHRPALMLGVAHVDHTTDHKTIQVGHQAGFFRAVMLQVAYAPIQFDHVVIHYDDNTAQTLPVREFIRPGSHSRWIRLPGGRRYIHSVEIWFARAQPNNPTTPEVVLYGRR